MRLQYLFTFFLIFLYRTAVLAEEPTPIPRPLEFNNYQVDLRNARLSECPDINDPLLRIIKSPDGLNVYAYKDVLPEHFKEWKDSVVSDEIIKANVISIPDVVCQKKNLKRLEFFTPIVDFMGWKKYKIPYHPKIGIAGWIARGLDAPEFKTDNLLNQLKIIGSARPYHKYEAPYQNGVFHTNTKNTYLKISSEQATFIFKRMNHTPVIKDNFWKEVFESEIPVYLTEGSKKAGSLLTIGYPAVSVNGVCAGMHILDEKGVVTQPRLRSDLLELIKHKRRIYIVFDNDDTRAIKDFVFNSLEIFADLLQKEGAVVKIIDLPGPEKGVDDFIVAKGLRAFKKLSDSAVDFKDWKKIHDIEKGDLGLITQYYGCRI